MVGRKLVKDTLSDKTVSQLKAERFLLGYASSVCRSNLFKKGNIRFAISQTTITLNYVINGYSIFSSCFRYSIGNRNGLDRVIYKAQDFVINTFVDYERDGLPMKYKDLGIIMGIKAQSAEVIVKGIVDKLKQGKSLLE